MSIGGNKTAQLQINSGTVRNEIGEKVPQWTTRHSITGWLDLQNGDSKYTYNAKIQESTHVFVSDYVQLDADITAENTRILIDNRIYNVTFIDNPMEMNKQLEIYLRFTGG